MRVLYFSTDYGPHDHRFLSALAPTGHEILFLRLARLARRVEDRPVPESVREINWMGGRRTFRWIDVPVLLRDLRRVLEQARPDLIHAGPIQTCAFLAILSGFRPVLTMSWGFDLMQDAERNLWWRAVTRYTLRRSTYFVSDAQVTRTRAVQYGMRADRTAVFPWGVDLQQFRPAARKAVAVPERRRRLVPTGQRNRSQGVVRPKPFVLLCNRSWEPRYGVDVLARGFVEAGRNAPELSLILLGGGSQAQIIRRVLLDGGMLKRVTFGGQISQRALPSWYQKADLFVSPSHVDGSSVSLMEALACGIPVLVSDIPANKEWVRENVNGWLFRDGDSEDLSAKIRWICARRSRLVQVGREARRTAAARADWGKNFKVLLRSYERATDAP